MKAVKIGVLLALLVLCIIYLTESFIERKIDSMIRKGLVSVENEVLIEYDKVFFNLISLDLGVTNLRFFPRGSEAEPISLQRLVLFKFDTDRSHKAPHSMSIYLDGLTLPMSESFIGDFMAKSGTIGIDRVMLTMFLTYDYIEEDNMLVFDAPSFRLDGLMEGRFKVNFTNLPQKAHQLEFLPGLREMEILFADIFLRGLGEKAAPFPAEIEIAVTWNCSTGVTLGDVLSVESIGEFTSLGFMISKKNRSEP